jgi:hypothetical protein
MNVYLTTLPMKIGYGLLSEQLPTLLRLSRVILMMPLLSSGEN